MASNNKKKKLKNSYCVPGELKNKSKGPKKDCILHIFNEESIEKN